MRLSDRRTFLLGCLGFGLSSFATPAFAARSYRAIALWRPSTGEKLFAPYYADGQWQRETFRAISWIMRDHHEDRVHKIDPRLIVILSELQRLSGTRYYIEITSGYRTQETNTAVEGAPHSLHMQGMAADIRLKDVDLDKLAALAISFRGGGCGRYPSWLHIDCGKRRVW